MAEPAITCPHCKSEIKLTESLAAPLIESMKKEFIQKLEKKDNEIARREAAVRDKEHLLTEAKSKLDEQVVIEVQEQLKKDRKIIEEKAGKKALMLVGNDLNNKTKEVSELQEILKNRDQKLAEAQKVQAESIKKQREFEEAKREMDLTIEKRVQEGQEQIRLQAQKEAEDSLMFKISEKELTISSMQQQIGVF